MNEKMNEALGQVNQRLQTDVERVYLELERLPDAALEAAMLGGLEQGQRRAIRAVRKRWSLSMFAGALCIILLLTAFVRVSPSFAAMVRDIPGLSGFVELINGDKSLLSAIENELIQPINFTQVKDDYSFTVEGIIADEQRLVILYTAEGPDINRNTGFIDYKIRTGDGREVEAVIISSHNRGDDSEKGSVPVHDYLDILMADGVPMPESIQFSLLLGNQWMRIDFTIDHERFKDMKESLSLEKAFEVDGQHFKVKEAIITPLQVTLTFEADLSNEKQANHMINMQLVDEKGRTYETITGFGSFNPSLTRHFKNNYFASPKKLTLVAEGLYLSEKNQSITVDTDKMVTISSPQNKLQLVNKQQTSEGELLEFELTGLDEIDMQLGYMLFEHKGAFKDGGGQSYHFMDHYGVRWNAGDNKAIYSYKIPNADYEQPLTFDIEQYPGYVMEPISISIK